LKFRIGKTALRIHSALLFFWMVFLITGAAESLASSLLALLLHETGHLLAAKRQGQTIEEIEIAPYGAVITLANLEEASPLSALLTALAGPVFSLIGCFLAAALEQCGIFSFSFARLFAKHNLLLLLLNLFPALPMDGGRMLRAVLSVFLPYTTATRWLIRIGYLFSAWLMILSLYYGIQGKLILSPAFAGIYLMYAAALEGRQGIGRYITSLIARRKRLEDHEYIEIKEIAAGSHMPLLQLLPAMHTGKLHRIYVLSDDGMDEKGIVLEKDFFETLMQRQDATLEDVLKTRRK